jgi:hypothetical protein
MLAPVQPFKVITHRAALQYGVHMGSVLTFAQRERACRAAVLCMRARDEQLTERAEDLSACNHVFSVSLTIVGN